MAKSFHRFFKSGALYCCSRNKFLVLESTSSNVQLWMSAQQHHCETSCRPHVAVATACQLLAWACTLLVIITVLNNNRARLQDGLVLLSPALLVGWAFQTACFCAFAISGILFIHRPGRLHTSKVNSCLQCNDPPTPHPTQDIPSLKFLLPKSCLGTGIL